MSHSLNSLKGGYVLEHHRGYQGGSSGFRLCLKCSSCSLGRLDSWKTEHIPDEAPCANKLFGGVSLLSDELHVSMW